MTAQQALKRILELGRGSRDTIELQSVVKLLAERDAEFVRRNTWQLWRDREWREAVNLELDRASQPGIPNTK